MISPNIFLGCYFGTCVLSVLTLYLLKKKGVNINSRKIQIFVGGCCGMLLGVPLILTITASVFLKLFLVFMYIAIIFIYYVFLKKADVLVRKTGIFKKTS